MAVNPFGLVQQQINQAEQHVNEEAKQPQFQPTLDKKATIRLANQYKSNPTGFNPQILESIQNHAAYHQVRKVLAGAVPRAYAKTSGVAKNKF